MALRLGKFCGNGPDLWLRMQATHDLWHARQSMAAKLDSIPTMTPVGPRGRLAHPEN
jgi:plasmid maintenance system antidote protein VapI